MHARANAAAAVLGKIGVGVEVDHVAENDVATVARDVADVRAARDFVDAVDRRHAHVFELESVDLLDDGGARIGLGGRRRRRTRLVRRAPACAHATAASRRRAMRAASRTSEFMGRSWRRRYAIRPRRGDEVRAARRRRSLSRMDAAPRRRRHGISRAGDACRASLSCARGPRACRSAWSKGPSDPAASAPRAGPRHD